ncbi:hypothetical protein PDESU_06297 [Pontiella desulfatans]|uniref:PEP-CTERM protein-sorting domain-containing protein n=1 Tax=Pontiella desulfatans TaxID=2750659 RepID=A0A6C2UC92_PONDE|nr:hypothetical protein [Pontiella desulfatans]VGO17695.1 hypothetical protein PDESU_06297 [Pontiella desulfatans]
MKKAGIVAGMLVLAGVANAEIVYSGDDGAAWSVGANWVGNIAPGNGSAVQIDSTKEVNWDFGGGWHSPGNPASVNLDGTLTTVGALRNWSTDWDISSTGTIDLGGNWLVLWGGGSSFTFDSGATLNQTSGRIEFGDSAATTLGFNLEATGFQTMSAGLLQFNNHVGQGIDVNMANYTGGAGTIVLMDFTGNNGMTDTIFKNDLNATVSDAGAYAGSTLQWNETTSAIELNVIPEPATLGLVCGFSTLVFFVRRIFIM